MMSSGGGLLRFHPSLLRRVSYRASPTHFTSYFWRNDRWSSTILQPLTSRETQPRDALYPLRTSLKPSSTLIPFKHSPSTSFPQLVGIYANLSKSRLSVLIVLTAMSSVALSPITASLPVLLATAFGTALCSASANAFNQLQEVPYDAQMARTRSRPIVRHILSPGHVATFAIVTGIAGPSILWSFVNGTTALLGASNIVLYAGAYTYLKRRSIANTWVGAVVGAIPPLMGWTACGGPLIPSLEHPIHLFLPPFALDGPASQLPVALANNPLSAFALFLFLYSWQFPHFNSLSYLVRGSYAQAGYRMLGVLSPARNAAVALRHAVFLVPLCSIIFPLSGLTTWAFAITSVVPNLIMVRHAWTLYRLNGNGEREARKLWNTCLWYLPVVMGLMMLHKNGLGWENWFAPTNSIENIEEAEHSKD